MLTQFQKLEKLLWHIFDRKGLCDKHRRRLEWELREVDVQGKSEMFLDMFREKKILPSNDNNVMIPWLMGLCADFDIERDPAFVQGDMPDIDVDYLSEVRDYLKNRWAVDTFGEQYVCNIGNYMTFGLKSALIDMARVHGLPREQMLELTKNLDAKDEEGKAMTWDAAMKLYPKLKQYCDEHPDVADSARKLINRNRGMGQHAGGLIISSIPLSDLVPLVKRKDNPQASAWVEGLHGQDLQPVGLVKFDLLVISNLKQISRCCELIKQRHGMSGICALPGQPDWSDIPAWRNDPKALAMADEGDLKCIFQFDSEGIRRLVRAGGVDRFEDLVAYTSMYRPGPLGMGMHDRYTKRKRGEEPYSLHPMLEPILGGTYGVMCYQEQIMQMLNIVGEIPLRDCEIVRKAISKKKVEAFKKYKQMFIQNGMKNLSLPETEVSEIWQAVESFSEYGFNKSLHQDTYIPTTQGLKKIRDFQKGDRVYCVDESGNTVETEVVNLHDHGILECYSVVFDDGYEVVCTLDHKFLTHKGQVPLHEILAHNISVLCEREHGDSYGKKKNMRMEFEVRESLRFEKQSFGSSKDLCKMPGTSIQDRRVESALRENLLSEFFGDETSACMSGMSKAGMGREDLDLSMPRGVRHSEINDRTPDGMRGVQENKKGEYKGEESEDKQVGRTSQGIFDCSQKNIGTTGDSSPKSRKSQKMEVGEPRKVCEVHGGCGKESQAIKVGGLAERTTWMEHKKDSMWKKIGSKMETGRHGQGEDMDRGGWILPLFRTPEKHEVRELSTACCQGERRHAERGMSSKEEHYFDQSGHVLFSQQYSENGNEMVGSVSVHAPISETGRLVPRRVLRAVPVGKQRCYDLEVACPTHNFVLPSGIVTSNSHAVAYTYISSRLLYLKSHYPPEFYAAVLSCETDSDKINEYKIEARRHGVEMHRVDVNKSRETFDLVGDTIYFGLGNVKGIGEAAAKRIVAGQPYAGFEDFLQRYGTDAAVMKCIVGLRCFEEKDPVTLWKFYEHYKSSVGKFEDKRKRFVASMGVFDEEFARLLPGDKRTISDFSGDDPFGALEFAGLDVDEVVEVERCVESDTGTGKEVVEVSYMPIAGTEDFIEVHDKRYVKKILVKKKWNRLNELRKLWNKRQKAMERFSDSQRASLPTLKDFKASEHKVDKAFAKELRSQSSCESKYYGFPWTHNLEKSPDFKGFTFQTLKDNDGCVSPVEVEVVSAKANTSQKGNSYLSLEVEDARGERGRVNVWEDDRKRWGEEFVKGNLLRLRLCPPSGGFTTYTLEKNPKQPSKNWQLRYPTKESDYRVCVLGKPSSDEDFQSEDDVMEQFGKAASEE